MEIRWQTGIIGVQEGGQLGRWDDEGSSGAGVGFEAWLGF